MATKIKGEKIKEGSVSLSALKETPYAHPVEYFEGTELNYKVVELGGEKLYNYIGEISIPAALPDIGKADIEGTLPTDILPTEYAYQPTYEGVMQPYFESYQLDHYLNLYIGNDKYGYTSLKIEPSEDPNNLKWFDAMSFGMFQEGPGSISFAWSNYTLYYRATSFIYWDINIKVFWLYKAQKLDINLIPQEIARKEEVAKALDNYDYPLVTIDAASKTYSGQVGSKQIKIDINIAGSHFNYNNILNYKDTNGDYIRYSNEYINIIFIKETNIAYEIRLLNPSLTTYEMQTYDYKNCYIISGNCKVIYNGNPYPATLDGNDIVTTLIHGKYLKYKLNRETHLLELQQEIDLNSIEGGADWNAQEGEPGYIKNKPFYSKGDVRQIDVDGDYIVNIGSFNVGDKVDINWDLNYYDGEIFRGNTSFVVISTAHSYYEKDNLYINGTPSGIELWVHGHSDSLYGKVTVIVNSEVKTLEEKYISNTVIKTTPQTLSTNDKNQALANLGIDPVVWKYICNPINVASEGEDIPDELTLDKNSGECKLKYPIAAMYTFNGILPIDVNASYLTFKLADGSQHAVYVDEGYWA